MATRSSDGITQLLERWSNGEENARDELMSLVYDELHHLAVTYLRRERRQHTLQPTALVNELFLKFSEQHSMSWQNRAQFFGVAAQLMRRILVDYARAHYAEKRGGDRLCVSLRNIAAFGAQPDADLLALHGLVKGGAVGRCATEAFFCQPVSLETGSKLRLLIETKKGLRFITTSKIETIKHLRSE